MESKKGIIFGGALIGLLAVLLVQYGNPLNMGLCIACFIRDIAGALGLHRAEAVQFMRPEIIGIVSGAYLMAQKSREFEARGGSAPLLRFVLGFTVMIGALMFLGCPLRMVLRLGGGDFNAIFGLAGFIVGIGIGIVFLHRGFSLQRNYRLIPQEGFIFPVMNVSLLLVLCLVPGILFFSIKGPGSQHAPLWLALIVGLVVGAVAQRTRLCMVGGIRDLILFKDSYLLSGFLAILLFSAGGNYVLGFAKYGFAEQPVAHVDVLWNFLGMVLTGWGSVLLGGCPLRQLILAGQGNIDSAVAVLGMTVGAAFAHNFSLASSPAGPTFNGKVAVILSLLFVVLVSYVFSEKFTWDKREGAVHYE